MLPREERKEEIAHFLGVISAFKQYEPYSITANNKRRRDFYKLSAQDQKTLEEVGWKSRLDRIDELIALNARVLNEIVDNPEIFMDEEELSTYQNDPALHGNQSHSHSHDLHDHSHGDSHTHSHSHGAAGNIRVSPNDMDKVRSTLKQFVRDWSNEGRSERQACYEPIIKALIDTFPSTSERAERRVLIPGAGLARLGWEVAYLGFESRCNEFSHFMLLPSYYVLNKTKVTNQHTIYPFLHSFSNVKTPESLFRGISFPDTLPSSLPAGSNFSMVAGDFEEIFGPKEDPEEDEAGQWDAVLTCFFIDTAKNIVNYLRTIHRLLAPDGVWINCGPLLWHFENSDEISIEMTLDEVKTLARKIGFELENEREIETTYVGDNQSMLGYVYKTSFWTARKKGV